MEVIISRLGHHGEWVLAKQLTKIPDCCLVHHKQSRFKNYYTSYNLTKVDRNAILRL